MSINTVGTPLSRWWAVFCSLQLLLSGVSVTRGDDMALIPAGVFQMGDTFNEGANDERPVHILYISAFYMDKYEVNKALWDEVATWAASSGYGISASSALGKAPTHPAYHVSWYEAVIWCNARTEYENHLAGYRKYAPCYYTSAAKTTVYRNGFLNLANDMVDWQANGYRLPTEAEWEKAARGGLGGQRFPWGDTISHSAANYYSSSKYAYDISPTRGYHPTYYDGTFPATSPVGSFAPNLFGLYDMIGNVLEWCWDRGVSYSDNEAMQKDCKGTKSGSNRIWRGGLIGNEAYLCRASSRSSSSPDSEYYLSTVGFRCVRSSVAGPGFSHSDDHQLGDSTLSAYSDDPVNTATGNFVHRETDILIPSVGQPLVFSRFFNSQDVDNGPLGMAWTHNYNIHLYAETGTVVAIKWDDGRVDRYRDPVEGLYTPVYPECRDTLRREADQTWTLTRRSLDQYRFDTLGRLASIADRNGNRLDFEYNPQSRLDSVTAPDGRALTFTYTDARLTLVTDPAGRTVHYAYSDNRLTRVTDVLGGEIVYAYDAGGYLNTITDQRGGKTVENEYDTNGRVIRQWDGNGNQTDFAYDTPMPGDTSLTSATGDVTIHTHTNYVIQSMTYPDGSAIHYTYDEKLNRTSIEDRNGNRVTFAYDARGNVINTVAPDGGVTVTEYTDPRFPDFPTRKTDALGVVTAWEYDARGNVAVERRAVGKAIESERTWTYNAAGQAVAFTNEMGHVTQFGYEANAGPLQGVLRWSEDSQGHCTHYDYDILWRRTAVTDARGAGAGDPDYTFQYGYDLGGRLTWAATPLGIATNGFDAVGNRTRVTDPNGNETTYEYDAQSNLRFVREPLGRTTEFRYDALNRKALTIDPNGHSVSNRYDALGNLTAVTRLMDGDGPDLTTSFTHDSHGNVLTATDSSGRAVRYEYDAMHGKVAQSNDLGHVWRWEYDPLGRVTRATDANGATTAYAYDALGRLETVTQQDDQGAPLVTRYTYDLLGNLTQVTDAAGRTSQKEYDSLGRLILQRDGNGNEHRYAYDVIGNQTNVLDANGNAIRMVYDAESRLSEIRYPDASTVAFTYDAAGNRLTMTDRTGTTRFAYDALNRLVTSTSGFGDVVGYAYDASGNRTGLAYPGERPVAYAYDAANRLRSITDWETRVTRYSYDEAGRMTGMEYPNTVEQARFYDAAGRLSGLQYSQGSSPFLAYAFTRDPQGNPRRISSQGNLPPTFDLPPDVISTHDDDNRLTESTEGEYFHDANGNMTGRVVNAVSTAFAYDFNDMLIRQQTGGNVVEHLSDGQGWRVARTENGVTNRYILDYGRSMSHVLCEVAPDGSIAASYIHGPMIAARLDAAGVPRYYHTDAIGSVVALTDATGAVTDRYAYTPYGVPAGAEGATPNPFRYVGGLGCMDEADKLIWMRRRIHDPLAGRLHGKDPWSQKRLDPIARNAYAYAYNRPLLLNDPTGEIPITAENFGWQIVDTMATGGSLPFYFVEGSAVGGVSLIVGLGGIVMGEPALWELAMKRLPVAAGIVLTPLERYLRRSWERIGAEPNTFPVQFQVSTQSFRRAGVNPDEFMPAVDRVAQLVGLLRAAQAAENLNDVSILKAHNHRQAYSHIAMKQYIPNNVGDALIVSGFQDSSKFIAGELLDEYGK